ncbi:MAG: MurR/RpiR family transcriptional regulator [Caldilineaceae bacterium]|nr:MurR/RpiR family transcriptional regulator [Caldilineaceae bacterium]
MYKRRIRDHYSQLSRSYLKIADYIMTNYFDVSFMTAAQLAETVGVDTTTIVRFSQRLGFSGYPDLLTNIRDQVKLEIYAAYEPQELTPDDPAATFATRIEQERTNLQQMLVHNPPEHVERVAAIARRAENVLLLAEGYAEAAAELTAEQLRHRGISAEVAAHDLVKRAATLLHADGRTVVIGIGAGEYGDDVARTLEFARGRGCPTLGVIGSLASPINRAADEVIYAPTHAPGPLPSVVALTAALAILVELMSEDDDQAVETYGQAYAAAFQFLRERPSVAEE